MAKKIKKILKLLVKGGAANPAPPLGPALGAAQVNIAEFIKQFNETTKDKMGEMVSIVLTAFDDRSFEFIIKTSPVTEMLKKAAKVSAGSGKNRAKKAGKITKDQLRAIAIEKMPDLTAKSVEAAMNTIAGSARSMGIDIVG